MSLHVICLGVYKALQWAITPSRMYSSNVPSVSRTGFWIHHNPDKDKMIIEDDWVTYEALLPNAVNVNVLQPTQLSNTCSVRARGTQYFPQIVHCGRVSSSMWPCIFVTRSINTNPQCLAGNINCASHCCCQKNRNESGTGKWQYK